MTYASAKSEDLSLEPLAGVTTVRRWLIAALVCATVIVGMLGALRGVYVSHDSLAAVKAVSAQQLRHPGPGAIDDDAWSMLMLPDKLCRADCTSRFKVYRARVELPEDAAIYLPMFDGAAAVYLNGHKVGQSGSMADPIADMTYQPTMFRLPLDLQVADGNRLDIFVSSLVPAGGRLMPFHVGPANELHSLHAPMSFLTVGSLGVVNGIFAILGFFALLLYVSGDRDRLYLWFTLLIAFAAARNLNVLLPEWPGIIETRNWIYLSATLGVLLTTGALVSRFASQTESRLDILLISLIIPASALIAWDLQSDLWASWLRVNLVIRAIGIVIVPLVLLRFLLHARTLPVAVHATIFGLLTAGLVLVLHDIVLSWPPRLLVFQLSNLAALPIVLSFCVTLVSRYAGHLRKVRAHNIELRHAVAERERELAEIHARETIRAQREALNEERQRIMRDMHDGVAGRLAVMIQKLRRSKDADAPLTNALQQSLTDLRLAIDSLDEDPDLDLSKAMDMFRIDMQPTLDSSDIEFCWDYSSDDMPRLGPTRTLHLYRCLQEAINNVLRHSGATRASVQIHGAGAMVEIRVDDNGRGFDVDAVNGRGLGNIRRRIESIGGNLDVRTGEGGTSIRIVLPAETPHIRGGVEPLL